MFKQRKKDGKDQESRAVDVIWHFYFYFITYTVSEAVTKIDVINSNV